MAYMSMAADALAATIPVTGSPGFSMPKNSSAWGGFVAAGRGFGRNIADAQGMGLQVCTELDTGVLCVGTIALVRT
jgi:hypothetical protein